MSSKLFSRDICGSHGSNAKGYAPFLTGTTGTLSQPTSSKLSVSDALRHAAGIDWLSFLLENLLPCRRTFEVGPGDVERVNFFLNVSSFCLAMIWFIDEVCSVAFNELMCPKIPAK